MSARASERAIPQPGGPERTQSRTGEIPIEAIKEAVAGVRFGVVQLIIQDGRIVQIDKTEKIRLA